MVFKKLVKNVKMFIIILCFLIYLVIFYFFPEIISKFVLKNILNLSINLLNVDTTIHGDEQNLSKNKVLIMANHYHGVIDGSVLYKMYYKNNTKNTLYTVVKSNIVGDKTDNSYLSSMLYYIKDSIIRSLYFIPYIRGDKEDGTNVKNTINECLNNNKNVFIFPEGTTTKNGIPKEFKTGIFRFAIENKIDILPITIKYDKDIGNEKGDPFNHYKLFDTNANVYIHDIIESNTSEYYKTNDFIGLKNKTYDIICSPFNLPKKEEEKKGEENDNVKNDNSDKKNVFSK
jgi:1-acyl-sn-glycerol-3-phosphate acyltransferase